jgi:hypothetical protein
VFSHPYSDVGQVDIFFVVLLVFVVSTATRKTDAFSRRTVGMFISGQKTGTGSGFERDGHFRSGGENVGRRFNETSMERALEPFVVETFFLFTLFSRGKRKAPNCFLKLRSPMGKKWPQPFWQPRITHQMTVWG